MATDTRRALLDSLGSEIVEVHVERDLDAVVSFLQARGAASADSFSVGSTVTVPLRGGSAGHVIDSVTE